MQNRLALTGSAGVTVLDGLSDSDRLGPLGSHLRLQFLDGLNQRGQRPDELRVAVVVIVQRLVTCRVTDEVTGLPEVTECHQGSPEVTDS